MENIYNEAAKMISEAKYAIAFTGAGISVESGIPPFRGKGGLWNKYDPSTLDLDRFMRDPSAAWPCIKEIFYDHWGQASPNAAHMALASLEKSGLIKGIITMNIDALHQKAGSSNVVEYHGTLENMECLKCGKTTPSSMASLSEMPPRCQCGGALKPGFIFFGEGIPKQAYSKSMEMAAQADLVLVIGTTGEVMPACGIPVIAARKGARIIEINPSESSYSRSISRLHIKEAAGTAMSKIMECLAME